MNMVLATASAGGLDSIIEAASKAIEFSGTCLNAMTSNGIYVFFLGAGLVGLGLSLVGQLRGTARG